MSGRSLINLCYRNTAMMYMPKNFFVVAIHSLNYKLSEFTNLSRKVRENAVISKKKK